MEKTKKALFVHGLGSGADSTTGSYVRAAFKRHGIETVIETYDLFDVAGTLKRLENAISSKEFNYIVGHSFGGFYTQISPNAEYKMLINPCMIPSVEIPKLTEDIPAQTVETLKYWEKQLYEGSLIDNEAKRATCAFFGDNDELFSFKDLFEKHYSHNAKVFKGTHKPEQEEVNKMVDEFLALLCNSSKL